MREYQKSDKPPEEEVAFYNKLLLSEHIRVATIEELVRGMTMILNAPQAILEQLYEAEIRSDTDDLDKGNSKAKFLSSLKVLAEVKPQLNKLFGDTDFYAIIRD